MIIAGLFANSARSSKALRVKREFVGSSLKDGSGLRPRARCDILSIRSGPADRSRCEGRNQMIQASGIDHIVLHVADVQRSKKFYTERLGMEVYRENDRHVFLPARTQGVALFRRGEGDPMTAGGDMNHLALRVAGGTYESLKGELEAHGVAVSGRPGDDHCIYFNDPDGHRLQLMFRK